MGPRATRSPEGIDIDAVRSFLEKSPGVTALHDLHIWALSTTQTDVTFTKPGTLFALTPTIRPKTASQEEALQQAGFTKVEVPETQLFPGEINRVSLYRKAVKPGERLQFKKMVLLILADGAAVREAGPNAKP